MRLRTTELCIPYGLTEHLETIAHSLEKKPSEVALALLRKAIEQESPLLTPDIDLDIIRLSVGLAEQVPEHTAAVKERGDPKIFALITNEPRNWHCYVQSIRKVRNMVFINAWFEGNRKTWYTCSVHRLVHQMKQSGYRIFLDPNFEPGYISEIQARKKST